MIAVKRVLLFLSVLSFACYVPGFADQASLEETVRQLQERVKALESKYEARGTGIKEGVSVQAGPDNALTEGLEIGAGGTMVIQGTSNVNDATSGADKKVSRNDVSYSADITIGKEFEGTGGKAFLHFEAGKGSGLEDNLTLYSNVNRDAGDSTDNAQVTEFWYEQGLAQDIAVLTFGKLDPSAYFDNNEIANDETTQFLGRIFRNSPVIEFPDNTAGIRLAYTPFEWLELGGGAFDANSDWEEAGDNLFNIAQATFKTNFFGFPGGYRFLGWYNNTNHTKWLATERVKEAAFGFGLSFDQKVTDIATAFCRYGWQDPEVYNPDIMATGDLNYSLEQSWSAGLQIEGKPWGRENDLLAFAVGQVIPSDDYKKYTTQITDPKAKPEGHLEAYYRIHVNDHLSLSPDFQYIWNPFGKDAADDTSNIFVCGIRAQVGF